MHRTNMIQIIENNILIHNVFYRDFLSLGLLRSSHADLGKNYE